MAKKPVDPKEAPPAERDKDILLAVLYTILAVDAGIK